ncbi:MAG: ABC transporter ATP-binding protein [Christensenellales bacterium]
MVKPDKKMNLRQALGRLMPHLKPYRGKLIMAVVLAILSSALAVAGPKILGQATTEIFTGLVRKVQGLGGIDFGKVLQVLLLLLGLYVLSSLFRWTQGRLMVAVAMDFGYRLNDSISKKVHRMPLKYFEQHAVGDVLSLVSNDVDLIGQNLAETVTQAISGIATVVGVTVMMLSINWIMTLLVVLIVPLSGLLMALVFKRSQHYFKDQQAQLGEINGQVEETYSGQTVVQIFNHEADVEESFNKTNGKLYGSAWKSQFLSGLMFPIMTFVGNLGYVAVTIVGALLAVAGSISVGDIQAFTGYVRSFTQPIGQFAQMSSQIQGMAAATERVFSFLEEAEEVQGEELLCLIDVKGEVAFDHVAFGYEPGKPVIRDFNCQVAPGQTVALVGQTGAGKTTMVKLLMRFYDVDSGDIKVDGVDVRRLERGELRKSFGMVLQDAWLFSGTIMENIRYGRLGASDEEVIDAAKAAHADHFIRTLPGGYQMELNEAADNISQGQRQLLTIARAFLADNPVMILDEATSNVDTLTEHRIQRAMKKLMQGRTSFVIAHRLSTIREADLILVMEGGDIKEQGTHESLMAAGGVYAELYNSQFDPLS